MRHNRTLKPNTMLIGAQSITQIRLENSQIIGTNSFYGIQDSWKPTVGDPDALWKRFLLITAFYINNQIHPPKIKGGGL